MHREEVDARLATGHAHSVIEHAPAKINLTLRVLGRRADGYHDIESVVVFARTGDRLSFAAGGALDLTLGGPYGSAIGAPGDNLVLKAARALAASMPGLTLGRFALDKQLPVAAGLGGGSADAAAALRLLAGVNGLALDDPRVFAAARSTGADVPVCLEARPRVMRGIGDRLAAPLALPVLAAVLVNPGVAVATRDVFSRLALAPGEARAGEAAMRVPTERGALIAFLRDHPNDLEPAALALAPIIADVLAKLKALPACRLARMSGSGATCFALFDNGDAAATAARALAATHPDWWVEATELG
jgi:4-diphosphocytidyl-2-C-methyl-D-erythritol kinase